MTFVHFSRFPNQDNKFWFLDLLFFGYLSISNLSFAKSVYPKNYISICI